MTRWFRRLRARIRYRHFDRELAEEIEVHRALKEADLRSEGVAVEEARYRASRELGNVLQAREASRGVWLAPWLEGVWQDVRYALRQARRSPGFTLTVALVFGLGIGANTAIFSIVDATMLRPLPYPDAERLVDVVIDERSPEGETRTFGPSMADLRDWQEHGQPFSNLAAWRPGTPVVLDGPEPERVEVRHITEDYLGVYGVTPALGRGFVLDDMNDGQPAVVLLGYGFWQRRFGGDRDVIGRAIRLDGEVATVVGVLPRSFYASSELWRPLRLPGDMFAFRGSGATTYGRLRPGMRIDQARRLLQNLVARRDAGGGPRGAPAVRLVPLSDIVTGQ